MYACPNCGGNLKFDIPSQQLACEYCHTQADPYSFEDKDEKNFANKDFEVTVFSCPQCGGEIVSTDNSAAEFCTFCGASTILHSRLRNEKRPNYIIPFKKTKEDCKKEYSALMKKAIFAPDALKDPKYIDGFRGIYMPYWAFYVEQQGDFQLSGSRTRRRGDYIITDHYNLKGDIDAYYKGLSYDASSSFDDNISEKLAPFDVKGMKAFTPAFLSGFYADTADVDSEEYRVEAENFATEESAKIIRSNPEFAGMAISGSLGASALGTHTKEVDSTMFPVWFMSYRNAGRVAYATVNGQTGKVVTDLPVDTRKYLWGSLILAVPLFILLNLFFTLMPSTLLIITTVLAGIALAIYFSELGAIKKKEKLEKKKDIGLITAIAALILGIGITILQPVSDLFYYGGALVSLVGIFVTIKDIMYYYNIMTTRRLPQFDRTGGDDRA
ncbi:MAG: hypothetical protein E7283_04795 [Lachnospiraceae bacterium]|nr:hypothetical protein [Lachnospiraceae bacterium]